MANVIGLDEVGRGCWAGPLVAAAVMLKEPIAGLNDSKKLSKKQRESLAEQIHASASVGIGWVSPADIDKLGLTAATSIAMSEAIQQLDTSDAEIIIDGSINFLQKVKGSTLHISRVKTMVKADAIVPAVSAASIIAKVARDNYMAEQALLFPQYMFEQHVGYGTKLHVEMLKLHGVCELHRLSYKPIQALLT